MQPQKTIEKQELTSTPKEESNPPQLSSIFDCMSTTSHAVNRIASTPTTEEPVTERPTTVFESLQMLTRMQPPEPPRRKKAKIHFEESPPYYLQQTTYSPQTPIDTTSKWNPPPRPPPPPPPPHLTPLPSVNTLPFFSYMPSPPFQTAPIMNDEPMSDDDLVKMKGPSRLIGFLVHLAMNEKARRALRWTGNGLEFVLVNKELVAKMWGNRKHNTKDMDYYKLSRAIREKYDKKNATSTSKAGKLKKGSRTYSYVFTENAYTDLMGQTDKPIEFIRDFAIEIGNKYHDNTDLNNSNSPQAPSPLNSD